MTAAHPDLTPIPVQQVGYPHYGVLESYRWAYADVTVHLCHDERGYFVRAETGTYPDAEQQCKGLFFGSRDQAAELLTVAAESAVR